MSMQNIEGGQYPAILTKQSRSIKDLLNEKKNTTFLRDILVVDDPGWARCHYLVWSGNQSIFGSACAH